MTSLVRRIGLQAGNCVAVVGAGGKTTLCWALIQELQQQGLRTIFTTTTKIWEPQISAFDLILTSSDRRDTLQTLTSPGWRKACVMGAIVGVPSTQPIAGVFMPIIATKRVGLGPEEVCALHAALPDITLIVEADGARGLRLKVPGDEEPVIPVCADIVCVVANLDVIGQPLGEQNVHRADRFAALTGLALGDAITFEAVVMALAHPTGGLKSIPPDAHIVAVLTQHGASVAHPAAHDLAQMLLQHGYDDVVHMS